MDGLLLDLRHGFRMIFRTLLLSVVAILTIGLGVGATSFAFSVVYGTLVRGLPVRDADRLMVVSEANPAEGDEGMWLPFHDYVDFRDQQTSFEHLAGGYNGTVNVAGDEGPPERYRGAFVTGRMLEMLGVPPVLGRTFRDGDDLPGAPALAVLGFDVWRNRFGGDPDVVGKTARVNGETATIVGVMPDGFHFPFNEHIWLPLRVDPEGFERREGTSLLVAGYLREGVSREAASTEAATIARRIEEQWPEQNAGITATVEPYTDAFHARRSDDDDAPHVGHGRRCATGGLRERGQRPHGARGWKGARGRGPERSRRAALARRAAIARRGHRARCPRRSRGARGRVRLARDLQRSDRRRGQTLLGHVPARRGGHRVHLGGDARSRRAGRHGAGDPCVRRRARHGASRREPRLVGPTRRTPSLRHLWSVSSRSRAG